MKKAKNVRDSNKPCETLKLSDLKVMQCSYTKTAENGVLIRKVR